MVGWFKRLGKKLTKERGTLADNLTHLILGSPKIDATLIEGLEAILIQADLGVNVTNRILDRIQKNNTLALGYDASEVRELVYAVIIDILRLSRGYTDVVPPPAAPSPYVYMMVGVNGVGKTTTIAKLAHRAREGGKEVLLVAADTFRAAAIEQLEIWGQRLNVEVIRHRQGADPSAVIHDGLTAAKNRKTDVVIIDTAGRLQTKQNLMSELEKMHRVMAKILPGTPHDVLLVLDATTGQNALSQARLFKEAVGVTGIVLTKLDSTSKGGIVVAIVEELNIPVKWIGVGESHADFSSFDVEEFADSLVQAH
ncbi:MAG: signal recognition particle-docking protein FtsY [Nitrospiraceae bacterium]|nr:signal recognition particle-docking protein FtsY [Nitrospiraceae bacterium]|tara:strand:- start:412 stop:1344 length:933 start_codon:yes stop_codon:yes gene_type:complete